AISSDYGKLCYVSSLRNPKTGRYEHDGLASLYSEDSVQEALAQCHEEIFSRILELPLIQQERDLRKCLEAAGDQSQPVIDSWLKTRFFRSLCPDGLPDYLGQLFSSNMTALLSIFCARAA